jgi:integrase
MTVKRDATRGTWSFVIDLPAVAGKRQQMYRRGYATKKEAQTAETQQLAEIARGTFVRPARVTVERYLVDEWLPAKVSTLKPSTAASYALMTNSYVVPFIGGAELSKVDGAMLNALYAKLLTEGRRGRSGQAGTGLSPKSVRNVHGMLHRAFKDAVRWRRVAVNPVDAADQPRRVSPEMSVWTAEQIRRFVDHAADDRFGAVWRLFALTGMRRGEVLGLRWSDVDLDASRLSIRQTVVEMSTGIVVGTPKSSAGVRTIALDPATVAALRRWRKVQLEERMLMGEGWQDGDDRVATEPDGSAVHPNTLSRRFKMMTKDAALPAIRLHDVRHSYATAALSSGVNVKVVSKRLGHADIAVTLRVYAHVLPGDDEAAASAVAAFIDG